MKNDKIINTRITDNKERQYHSGTNSKTGKKYDQKSNLFRKRKMLQRNVILHKRQLFLDLGNPRYALVFGCSFVMDYYCHQVYEVGFLSLYAKGGFNL